MGYKKPFKLQSLQKLNNRVVEKDLRALAIHLVGAIMKAETTLSDMANKPTDADITPEAIVKSITESTTDLMDALKMLTPMGLRQMNVLSAQQGLTHKSSQEELEAFFKIITKPTEVTVEESIENVKARATERGDTQCNCMSCQLKRVAQAAIDKSELKEPTEKVKLQPQVKLLTVEVPEGGSVEDAVRAAMEAIVADREKEQKGKQTK